MSALRCTIEICKLYNYCLSNRSDLTDNVVVMLPIISHLFWTPCERDNYIYNIKQILDNNI